MFNQFSDDEGFALVVSSVLALITWGTWMWGSLAVMRPWVPGRRRFTLVVLPFLCAGVLFWVLRFHAAHDVRDDPAYLFFYMVMGAAWLGVQQKVLPLFGLSARDDVIERGNDAAAIAIGGALVGLTYCFAGANVGDGPGWWVVVFSAGLATGGLLGLWILLTAFTDLSDRITIGRDRTAGTRAAGFFISAGLILGRAAAGNWVSVAQTVADFAAIGWATLVLLGMAVTLERIAPAQAGTDTFSILLRGVIPAALLLMMGATVLLLVGPV